MLLQQQKRYILNRETIVPKIKQYIINNRAKVNKANREYTRERREDSVYRLMLSLAGAVRHALKGKGKSARTKKLIGCTAEKLKVYLEKQFTKGMKWNNYGLFGWHVDHIIPISSFSLNDPIEQHICFHYSNLQPLWAKDNLKKGSKIPEGVL